MFKAFADIYATKKLNIDLSMNAFSGVYARGNENNLHQADGTYYLGPGRTDAYAVVNLGGRYQVHRNVQVFAQINNLFDRKYYTGAQLGATGFTAEGNFSARPLPAVNGQFPLASSTFFAPGASIGAWAGIKIGF